MTRHAPSTMLAAALAAMFLATGSAHAAPRAPVLGCHAYEPVLAPANFVGVINNAYYPLPVGRVLTYRGVKNGVTQVDVVTVTTRTKTIEGIRARVVTDVAMHAGRLLEKTRDWFAQDNQGTVWYMGEATKAFGPNGTVDTTGSWTAGVNDAEPGIVMEANPRVPDAYRQECLRGSAEDTAWIVHRGGAVRVPYGRVHGTLTSLEASAVEPGSYDQKVYAPGLGIVIERSLTATEWAKQVRVRH
jgi:hypothetical protein